MKDYLTEENHRNRQNHKLFEAIVKEVFKAADVLVAHHIDFTDPNGLESINEIPSADTLIFDHHILKVVFKDRYLHVAAYLATIPVEERDEALARMYYARGR